MPNSRSQLVKSNRQHRLFSKALEKQFTYFQDRRRRHDLLLESFAAFLGFKAVWDNDNVTWVRIKPHKAVKAKQRRKQSHDNGIPSTTPN